MCYSLVGHVVEDILVNGVTVLGEEMSGDDLGAEEEPISQQCS